MTDDREQLGWWYEEQQDEDRAMALAKRDAYGSADLRLMAEGMKILAEAEPWTPTDRQATEMAIGFYQLGKIARKFGAWAQGIDPDPDSDVDLGVYGMMARATRDRNGGW